LLGLQIFMETLFNRAIFDWLFKLIKQRKRVKADFYTELPNLY